MRLPAPRLAIVRRHHELSLRGGNDHALIVAIRRIYPGRALSHLRNRELLIALPCDRSELHLPRNGNCLRLFLRSRLALNVTSPAPYRLIGEYGEGMINLVAARNRSDIAEPLHLHGNAAIGRAAVAELAALILSPRPDRAILLQCEKMMITRGNGLDVFQPFDWNGFEETLIIGLQRWQIHLIQLAVPQPHTVPSLRSA